MYADAFQYIMKQLRWRDHTQAALYRFKRNLSGEMQQLLATVEAGGTVVDEQGRPSLHAVIKACLHLEANLKLGRQGGAGGGRSGYRYDHSSSSSNNNNHGSSDQRGGREAGRVKQVPTNVCYKCNQAGHCSRECKN